jgi:hypothetical protein
MTDRPAPDLTEIPREELVSDLADSIEDAAVCEFALDRKIFNYPSGDVWPRLKSNLHFVEVITSELKRRRRAELSCGEALLGPALSRDGLDGLR